MRITVLIPAHNEERSIAQALASVIAQTRPPDQVVVILDNCIDRTAQIAQSYGEVNTFVTQGNSLKKAGALNQALAAYLPGMADDDAVFVMDADSFLDPRFFEVAAERLAQHRVPRCAKQRYGGIGGTFAGREGGGFVGWLQRNEYARYARDVHRRKGRVLVLTGTATMYSAGALKEVHKARLSGRLPGGGYVYDTQVLTEDNELTFALKHLGYAVRSPKQCTLSTEVMTSWDELYRQRLRWKRGAIENCVQYGLTRHTFMYWFRQFWTFLGIFVIAIYIGSIVHGFLLNGGVVLHPLWVGVTAVFAVERAVSVRRRGRVAMAIAAVVLVEMTFDLFLQCVHGKAIWDSMLKREKAW